MHKGKIKKLSDKGFGFIIIAGKPKDVFFHSSALVAGLTFKDLKEGDNVTIEDIIDNGKGDAAEGVDLA